MLPGVELARRRRVRYRGDAASSSAAAGEHHHHHHHHLLHADAHRAGPAAVAGPALAARVRLEEKLRGAALPPATSPSRWSRLMGEREGRATSGGRRGRRDHHQQQEQQAELRAPPPAPTSPAPTTGGRRRAELARTLSMVDVCAVCLDEVRERRQRVTRLPCSHKYHSECVLPCSPSTRTAHAAGRSCPPPTPSRRRSVRGSRCC